MSAAAHREEEPGQVSQWKIPSLSAGLCWLGATLGNGGFPPRILSPGAPEAGLWHTDSHQGM